MTNLTGGLHFPILKDFILLACYTEPKIKRGRYAMEFVGIICLLALYKYLDSPRAAEPIVIENYNSSAQ